MTSFSGRSGRSDASNRSGLIDTLRGLSILFVITRHIDIRIPFSKTFWASYFPDSLLNLFLSGGGFGVRIFFVISGFLITSTSLKRWHSLDRVNATAFYRLRFARIFPCFLALLVVISMLHLLGVEGYVIDPKRATLGEAWFAALGLHVNWLEAERGYLPANWDVLWTLSIEELFYLFFPLLCLMFRKPIPLALTLGVFVALGPFARTNPAANDYWQSKSYFSCMDGIAIGCLAAIGAHLNFFGSKTRKWLLVIGCAGFTAILFFKLRLSHGLTATALGVSTACLLIAKPRWEGLSALRYFGRSSYEVYLTHMFVVLTGTRLFKVWSIPLNWAPAAYLAMFALSGLLGDLVRRYFSEPLNSRLRAGVL